MSISNTRLSSRPPADASRPDLGDLDLARACGVELHPLVGQRRPGDVAGQLLQPLAVVCFDLHGGMQAETVDVGAPG